MNVKNIYKNYEKKFWELGNNLFAKPNEKQVVIMGVVSLFCHYIDSFNGILAS